MLKANSVYDHIFPVFWFLRFQAVIFIVITIVIFVVLFVIRVVLLLIVMFYVLFCVNMYCHRVSTQLQLINISISLSFNKFLPTFRCSYVPAPSGSMHTVLDCIGPEDGGNKTDLDTQQRPRK
jgi:hypothetical protein